MTEAVQRIVEMMKEDISNIEDSKKIAKIKGLWKGVLITESDIAEAKASLFRQ